jgi:hypothetical protein
MMHSQKGKNSIEIYTGVNQIINLIDMELKEYNIYIYIYIHIYIYSIKFNIIEESMIRCKIEKVLKNKV